MGVTWERSKERHSFRMYIKALASRLWSRLRRPTAEEPIPVSPFVERDAFGRAAMDALETGVLAPLRAERGGALKAFAVIDGPIFTSNGHAWIALDPASLALQPLIQRQVQAMTAVPGPLYGATVEVGHATVFEEGGTCRTVKTVRTRRDPRL